MPPGAVFLHSSTAAPIGVFDSGVGGLTVLRVLQRQLPQENFLYFGDTARLPYGTRSPAEIRHFVREILDWLQAEGCKLVVMACNTSSALALEALRADYTMPLIGLIQPAARVAVQRGQRIGVIATAATAQSRAYRHALREANPRVQVWEIGCPEFVPLVEQQRIDDPYTLQVAAQYLAPLIEAQVDTLIYGCTHYPHLAPVIQQLLPTTTQLLDPAEAVTRAVQMELEVLGLRHGHRPQPVRFCVSHDPQHFSQAIERWLGFRAPVDLIQLPTRSLPSARFASEAEGVA
ncbi:glutamate racemase [Synechococcus elongatus IITB3]